jgi:lysophospholipase L1-like esterase
MKPKNPDQSFLPTSLLLLIIGIFILPLNIVWAEEGLVAAFSFTGGSGNDESGLGNHGTLSGATLTPEGKFGDGLSFDGQNDWVTVPDTTSLDLETSFTLEAWVYPLGILSGFRTVLQKEDQANKGPIYGLYSDEGGQQGHHSSAVVVGSALLSEGPTLPQATWSHLAATYDGVVVRLYVDGAEVASQNLGSPLPTSSDPLRIGGNNILGQFFEGRLDEVRIYNRALTGTEIQTDMNTPISSSPHSPFIITAPANLTVMEPNAATFSVIAGGDPPLTYQWRRDGVEIPGAINDQYTLTLTNSAIDDGGVYDVIINNALGSITSPAAILTVQPFSFPALKKIMPLGDSITQGTIAFNSYRRPLWHSLDGAGYIVDFVGSLFLNAESNQPPNPDFDQDHEGHQNWSADEVLTQVLDWGLNAQPDIVLLHLGTTDITRGESTTSTLNELSAIIDALRQANPNVTILLAQIIPIANANHNAQVLDLNAQILLLGNSKSTTQSPVIVVDHYTEFDALTDIIGLPFFRPY